MTTFITLPTEDYQALLAEQQRLAHQLRLITVERDLLKERVDAFLHRLYAAKSEARANPAQRDLFLNEAEALAPNGAPVAEEALPEAVEVAGHSRKKRGRKPLDPHLPREIVRHELPEAERVCTHDGARLVEIGADISEQLDIVPQQIRVIQHHRIKYACPCCDDSIRVTSPPARIIPKGLASRSGAGLGGHRQIPSIACPCIGKPHCWADSAAICRAPPWRPAWCGLVMRWSL